MKLSTKIKTMCYSCYKGVSATWKRKPVYTNILGEEIYLVVAECDRCSGNCVVSNDSVRRIATRFEEKWGNSGV